MVAGTIALLKSARPGLTPAQYRSLAVNSTADLNPDWFDQFSILRTGSGLLDASAALSSTVATLPLSLGFGTATGTVDLKKTLTITNLGANVDTLALSVLPFDGTIPVELDTGTLQLDPGASGEVTVRFHAPIPAPGQYHGRIVIHSAATSVETRVPYWFGVPAGDAANIRLLRGPEIDPRASRSYFFWFRVTDAAGIAINDGVDVTVESGPGSITSVDSITTEFPGVFEAWVRGGSSPTVLRIQAGDRSMLVSVPGR
jgi:hypothetical protein